MLRACGRTRSERRRGGVPGRTAGVRGPHRRPAPTSSRYPSDHAHRRAAGWVPGGSRNGRAGRRPPPPDLPVIDLRAFAGSMLQLLVQVDGDHRVAKPSPRTPHPARRRTTWRRRCGALDTLTLAQPRDVRRDHVDTGRGQGRSASSRPRRRTRITSASEIMDAGAVPEPTRRHRRTVFPSREAADAAYASGGYSGAQVVSAATAQLVTTWD